MDAKMEQLILDARRVKASDIHITEGMPVWYRVHGKLTKSQLQFSGEELRALLMGSMDERQKEIFASGRDVDFGLEISDGSRQRVNIFRQQHQVAAAIRLLNTEIPTLEQLRMPTRLYQMAQQPRGLILVTGPTGSGKTYLVKTLARLLQVPLAIADATSLTEAGYIGDDIESVVSKLLAAADNDVERAEHGIIFIDEIDKIAKKKETRSRDVSGESVQQGMLKLLEGSDVEVPVGATSKNAMVPQVTVSTKNILFICGGAFPELDEIIKERLNQQSSIGFAADLKDKYDEDPNLLQQVTLEDLRNFGMIPEFLGRLPIIFSLENLTKDMLVKIMKEPRNAILKQYEKLLELDEVKLEFADDALEAIAQKAMEKKTGARALRSILEDYMLDIMYEIPKDNNIGTVVITGDYIKKTGAPVIQMRGMEIPALTQQNG